MKPLPLKFQTHQFIEIGHKRAEVIWQINQASGREDLRPLGYFADLLREPTVQAVYARDHSANYGYIITEQAGSSLFILQLAVLEGFTRRSVATQLLRRVAEPGKKLIAWVPETATAALCFFRDRGLRYDDRDPAHFFDPVTEKYTPGLKLTTHPRRKPPKGPLTVSITNRITDFCTDDTD